MSSPEAMRPQPKQEGAPPPGAQLEKLKLEMGADTQEYHTPNQDAYFLLREKGAAGVFDAISGHKASHIAVELASKFIQKELAELPRDISEDELQDRLRTI